MLSFTLPTDPNQLIKDLIDYHKQYLLPRYEKLQAYYLGQHDITKRRHEDGKPNNKVVNPYPDLIISTVAGYLLGQPVKYLSDDEASLQSIQDVLSKNNEEDHNLEVLKTFSVQGEAFELVYIDENADICFAQLPNEQTIAIYDDSIKPQLQLVLRYYPISSLKRDVKPQYKVELYWPDRIEYYSQAGGNYVLDDTVEHYFRQVPVVHYFNNKEFTGDFEKIVSLIDDYDKILSDNSNELEYFRNAYMVIKGFGDISDEDLRKMRKTGAFLLPGVNPDEEVSFITKDMDDQAVKSHLETLEANIHKFANVPNMTDENFAGNSSGVALKYKLWGFEQMICAKERKFKNALCTRLQLITTALNLKGHNYDYKQIQPHLTRNLPANMLEQSQILMNVKDVMDLIPLEDLFAQLSFIKDPQVAAEETYDKQATKVGLTPAA
jgi:SPP1 family phage portal protein